MATTKPVSDAEIKNVVDKVPEAALFVFNLVAPVFIKHGANWGCIYSKADYKEHEKSIEAASKYITERTFFDGGNACGFTLNEGVILNVVRATMPEAAFKAIQTKVIEAHKLRLDEKKRFVDYVRKLNRGTENKNGTAVVDVALYSINDSNYIVDEGVKYNAFKLTYKDMLSALIESGIKTSFNIGPCDVLAAEFKEAGITPAYINVEDFNCTKNMKTIVRKNAEIDDDYLAGVCFRLAFKVTGK